MPRGTLPLSDVDAFRKDACALQGDWSRVLGDVASAAKKIEEKGP